MAKICNAEAGHSGRKIKSSRIDQRLPRNFGSCGVEEPNQRPATRLPLRPCRHRVRAPLRAGPTARTHRRDTPVPGPVDRLWFRYGGRIRKGKRRDGQARWPGSVARLGGQGSMARARWPKARWPKARWPKARWPKARWPKARWPRLGGHCGARRPQARRRDTRDIPPALRVRCVTPGPHPVRMSPERTTSGRTRPRRAGTPRRGPAAP